MTPENQNLARWLPEAERLGATHVLDICDTWDYSHYPVYVMPEDNLEEKRANYSGNMQSVYGTYIVADYINEKRCLNLV